MSEAPAPRRISLCADDYGLSEGINRAIRDLIARRRLSATSVMVVTPAFTRTEIDALKSVAADVPGFAIGLHVTLTAPFHPLTIHVRPQKDGEFPKLGKLLQAGVLRRLDTEILRAEIAAQIKAFIDMTGKTPDYVDGHQHVQLFPQVREAFVAAVKDQVPNAWVRQCGRGGPRTGRFRDAKTLMLDVLSKGFRDDATRAGLRFNPAFAGAYNFSKKPDFAKLFERFLMRLPDGGLIMCHPGFVDATLVALDPFTDQRKNEYDWLISDNFPKLLAAQNVTLA
ncbi:ChbG/HpnK family deacetylase [Bradyrhizobium sp. LHD-71]|uniref:ChbG/HpnK family deacetylase n=1 Tax=Bradyrhizobium sp. LHD-71 TaxID=3072141 RepID=UPI00280D0C07|nr:ChbG/HpnK family deacetylase [Bradyrhizobium sp. LHD-71]MDQ8726795.1 ChbG/HpnK family deacetylase [Bradyrhizobium sp. LHD-71]